MTRPRSGLGLRFPSGVSVPGRSTAAIAALNVSHWEQRACGSVMSDSNLAATVENESLHELFSQFLNEDTSCYGQASLRSSGLAVAGSG